MHPTVRARTAVLVVLWTAAWFIVLRASAQDRDARFTLAWRGVPLQQALEEFATVAHLDLGFDPLLVRDRTAFCVARDEDVEGVLRCLLEGSGLDFYRRSSGLYVIAAAAESPPLYGNLRGIVLDAETRQPVSSAHVYLAEASRGRVASENGLFAFFRLLPGEYHLTVSHITYGSVTRAVEVVPGGNVETEVILAADPILMLPIVIDGNGMQPSSTLLGHALMEQEALVSQPGLTGAGAVSRLDALPGVRVNDATADVHIQGGEAGEHQFRLDGAPVFIPLNVASFIGPFSPFAIGTIRVHKAGFGAALGSQTSGVIDAEHDLRYGGPASADGGRTRSRTLVQVDPLSLNARHSLHIVRPGGLQATVMGAVRYGIWDIGAPTPLVGLLDGWNRIDTILLSAFAARNTPFADLPAVGTPTIGFSDVHFASRVRFGLLQTLHVSGYLGHSRLGNDLSGNAVGNGPSTDDPAAYRDLYEWRNGAAQARYEAVVSSRTLASIRLRASGYRMRHDYDARDATSRERAEDDGNRVYEVGLDARADYSASAHHYVQGGLEAVLTSDRFLVAGTQLLPIDHESRGVRAAGFAESRAQWGPHVATESGLRVTWLGARAAFYAEPRFSARFDFPSTATGTWSLWFGTGLYRQFVNQFDVSSRSPRTFVSSTRFWSAVDSSVVPPRSTHVAAELLWRPHPRWTLNAEVHYKRQSHILALDYAADLAGGPQPASSFLLSSSGSTSGYGATLRRSVGPGSIRLRYDFVVGRRTTPGLFSDRQVDVPWNEPHRLEIGVDVMPVPGLVLVGRWRTIRGRTWGFRQSYYDFLSAYVGDVESMLEDLREGGVSTDALERIQRQIAHYRLSEPEFHRLPSLDQLDLSVAWSRALGRFGLQARVDVVNVLGRENVADWRFLLDEEQYYGGSGDPTTSGILERDERLLLPRVVTFAVKLSW